MSIALLLDKSSFQGLNHDDIIELHRYYIVNISPLIVSEILGDLSKEEKSDRPTPKDQVTRLAAKMFPYNAYVNMDYKELLHNSLLGEKITQDNRPLVEAVKSINSATGKGLVFTETEQELSIKRWKNGHFTNIDEIISKIWRIESQKDDVVDTFKKHFGYLSEIKVSNNKASNEDKLRELKDKLESFIKANPKLILKSILEYYDISPTNGQAIFYRFESENFNSVEDFADYALYCYKIPAMYYLGINNSLFGERKTNLLDLEYLYYAPFAKVFTTNDNFLIRLFDAVKPDGVHFISLAQLKDDMTKFKALNTEENWSKNPPDKNTETYRIWDKEFDLELTERLKPSASDRENAMKRFKEILEMHEMGQEGMFEGEADFMIKESKMSLNDLCVCGSGKKLKDCHGKSL